jgi:basic amino acid/polyamine antiporter, APA family
VQLPDQHHPTLVRAVGLKGLSAGLFNTIVGAGIFVLPATVAGIVGSGAPIAYLFCAVAILFVLLSYAAAGSRVTEAGGSVAYIQAAFGPLAGFLGGVMIWMSDTLATASVATAFCAAVAMYVPFAAEPIGRDALLVLVVGGLAAINIRGVTRGTTFVELITVVKITPLLLFIAIGLALRWHDVPAPTLPSIDALGRSTIFLMFAFSGAETSMALSGEVIAPHRTIPRALLIALAVVTLVYGLVHAIAAAVLDGALASSTAAPIADAAAALAGGWLRSIVLTGGAISMLGYLSAVALATPRTVYAIGRAGILPRALGRVHPRFRTPYVAIVTQAIVTICIAATGTFASLVPAATVSVLVLYLTVCLAAWMLARRDVRADGEPFKVPSLVFAIGAVLCVWMLMNAKMSEIIPEFEVLTVAAVLFLLRTWRRGDSETLATAISRESAQS